VNRLGLLQQVARSGQQQGAAAELIGLQQFAEFSSSTWPPAQLWQKAAGEGTEFAAGGCRSRVDEVAATAVISSSAEPHPRVSVRMRRGILDSRPAAGRRSIGRWKPSIRR